MTRPPSWFIGLKVSESDDLLAVTAGAPPGISKTHPEDLHLTLAFLGEVDEAAAGRAFAIASARVPAVINAATGSSILLGPQACPWAICASITDGAEAVTDLVSALADNCRLAVGLQPEERAPLPHCTLASIDRGVGDELRAELLDWGAGLQTSGHSIVLDVLGLYRTADPTASTQYRCVEFVRLL